MKWVLIFWAGPVGFLFGWYGLSYYDVNLGTAFFSREMHDTVFAVYGNILGMEPDAIPPLVLKAIIVDTFLIAGIIWLKRNGKTIGGLIRSFFNGLRARGNDQFAVDELSASRDGDKPDFTARPANGARP